MTSVREFVQRRARRLQSAAIERAYEARLLDRAGMLVVAGPENTWTWDEDERVTIAAPVTDDGRIPERMQAYVGTFSRQRPFICRLEDVRLSGPFAVGVLRGGRVVTETTCAMRWCFVRSAPHSVVRHRRGPAPRIPLACSLVSRRSQQYGHWLQDYLPQLEALEHYARVTQETPTLIIDRAPRPWQLDSLRLMGHDPDGCVRFPGDRLDVERLVVPEYIRLQDHAPRDLVSPRSIRFLRRRVFENLPAVPSPTPRRILISRAKAPRRRLLNEAALLTALEPLGFERVVPDDLTFTEQVQIFRHAEVAVIPHGSCVRNTVFSTNLALVELFAHDNVRPDFLQVAGILGHRYGAVIGRSENELTDFRVDVDGVLRMIDRLTGSA